jgi:hypothetical protein
MSSIPERAHPAQLAFRTAAECRRWLTSLPLTSVAIAQPTVASQLALLRGSGLPALERLRICEVLREPIEFIQTESAKRYAGRPLPLDDPPLDALNKTLALWQLARDNYEDCLAAFERGEGNLGSHGSLIVLRCLRIAGRQMMEHHRVYREVGPALWTALNGFYALAEQHGFARTDVPDANAHGEPLRSCAAAYVHALLAALANPYALSVRQMAFLERWLNDWSPQVHLQTEAPPVSATPAIAVDLASAAGAALASDAPAAASRRYLDVEPLGRTLRQLLGALKQGRKPGQLGLGEDAHQPGCESMLMLLYIQWCRAGANRIEERAATEEKAQVCLGVHASHFYIGGHAFRQPGTRATRREEDDMHLFGRVTDRTERMMASGESLAIEVWEILNQSAAGFMALVREVDAVLPVRHGQLIAVRRATSRVFYIGTVQWLRLSGEGHLRVGARLFPGAPQAMAARPVANGSWGSLRFERALVLPEVSAPHTPASIILPSGWYQPGRVIELNGERPQRATLLALVEKGTDFDRCTFRAE